MTSFASWGVGSSADGGKYLQAQEVLHMPLHHQHPSMPLGGDQGGEEEAPIHFTVGFFKYKKISDTPTVEKLQNQRLKLVWRF